MTFLSALSSLPTLLASSMPSFTYISRSLNPPDVLAMSDPNLSYYCSASNDDDFKGAGPFRINDPVPLPEGFEKYRDLSEHDWAILNLLQQFGTITLINATQDELNQVQEDENREMFSLTFLQLISIKRAAIYPHLPEPIRSTYSLTPLGRRVLMYQGRLQA